MSFATDEWKICQMSIVYKRKNGSISIRDFKIGHYGRLGRLDVYTGGLGPWWEEAVKIFNLASDNKTEDGEVMCETLLSFLAQKAQLLKKSFLFYMKNTNQKSKGTN